MVEPAQAETQVGRSGDVVLALEQAVAVAPGVLLVAGWMVDADGESEGLSLHLGGERLPVLPLVRAPRADVNAAFAELVAPTAETGLVGLVPATAGQVAAAANTATLSCEIRRGRRRVTVSSTAALQTPPAGAAEMRLLDLVPVSDAPFGALRRLARALAVAGPGLRDEEDARVDTRGPERGPRVSLVIPIDRGAELLRHTLAYLAIDPDRGLLDVVVAVASPTLYDPVVRIVDQAATGLRVRVVGRSYEIAFDAAARLGVEAATAGAVVLMADDVIPPPGGWVPALAEELAWADFAVPDQLADFDGAPRAPMPPPAGHEELRRALHSAVQDLGLGEGALGLVAGRRAAMLAAAQQWPGYFTARPFWTDLALTALDHPRRGRIEGGAAFTGVRLDHAPAALAAALFDAHLLHQRLVAGAGRRQQAARGAA